MGDRSVVASCATALFVLSAWPLLLGGALPLQDVPNHLASESIASHLAQYPEYASNGLFKTNSALFLWLHSAGSVVGLESAAKVFVAVVIAVSAFAWTRAAFVFGGRERVLIATLLTWPFVHGWFVAMGMLDYALGASLGILLVCEIEVSARARRPSAGVALLAVLVWYTHAFALALATLVAVLIAVQRVRVDRSKLQVALVALSPILLGVTLAVWSFVVQSHEAPVIGHALQWRAPWETVYDVWALFPWAFTRREAASLVAVVVLFTLGVQRREDSAVPAWLLVSLMLLFFVLPFEADNWFAVNARVLPFLYFACIARLPNVLPRWLSVGLAVAAIATSVGLGLDYSRLSAEVDRYASASAVVPAGARILPLTFATKGSSENTAPLEHAWGLYVVRSHALAPPLAFGHSPSFPISYRQPQERPFEDLDYAAFVSAHAAPACDSHECVAAYDADWGRFWAVAQTRFDHLIVWQAPASVVARIPSAYSLTRDDGPLRIYVRQSPR